MGKQLEFQFMEDIRAEIKNEANQELLTIAKRSLGTLALVYGTSFGIVGGAFYLSKHPEVIETAKSYISQIFNLF